MRIPDRFLIDDGRHLLNVTINEDASNAAGDARYVSGCSCGRMACTLPGTHEQALSAFTAHVGTRIGPPKGPAWMPLGVRLALLSVTMLAVWMGIFFFGQTLVGDAGGPAAPLVRVGLNFAGMGAAFAIMVGMRRYIAPTRA